MKLEFMYIDQFLGKIFSYKSEINFFFNKMKFHFVMLSYCWNTFLNIRRTGIIFIRFTQNIKKIGKSIIIMTKYFVVFIFHFRFVWHIVFWKVPNNFLTKRFKFHCFYKTSGVPTNWFLLKIDKNYEKTTTFQKICRKCEKQT